MWFQGHNPPVFLITTLAFCLGTYKVDSLVLDVLHVSYSQSSGLIAVNCEGSILIKKMYSITIVKLLHQLTQVVTLYSDMMQPAKERLR